jgi:hypothetical protein
MIWTRCWRMIDHAKEVTSASSLREAMMQR